MTGRTAQAAVGPGRRFFRGARGSWGGESAPFSEDLSAGDELVPGEVGLPLEARETMLVMPSPCLINPRLLGAVLDRREAGVVKEAPEVVSRSGEVMAASGALSTGVEPDEKDLEILSEDVGGGEGLPPLLAQAGQDRHGIEVVLVNQAPVDPIGFGVGRVGLDHFVGRHDEVQ